jgi:DnaJ-class molecular chaperone
MDTTITELVQCPHCGGATVCNVEGNGSCLHCLVQNKVFHLERVVICSVCNGTGEIELPVERTDCRHCDGATYCHHGILDDTSCQSCINFGKQGNTIYDRYEKTVMEFFAEATMCSVCKGQGATPGRNTKKPDDRNRDRNRGRNIW